MGDTAQSSRVGSRFGRYHLRRLLGRGGMGEVYEAEDTVKERLVALKLLSPVLCQDPIFRERLQREARTAGRLQEPHVVPVHDYGEIDGQLYLDMRLIEGVDLSALLKQSGALTPPRAVAIVRQAASALDAAHSAGVIHRDIKPENILISRDDFAYLVDFGIARAATDEKLTQIGGAVGTWKYSAPERFTDAEATQSVDIYALACVLHECLTGSPPYRADSAGMLITAHLMEPIPLPSQSQPGIPRAFDAVIARGMAKDPKDRYASAGDLALAANDALSERDQGRAGDIIERSEETALPTTTLRSRPFTLILRRRLHHPCRTRRPARPIPPHQRFGANAPSGDYPAGAGMGPGGWCAHPPPTHHDPRRRPRQVLSGKVNSAHRTALRRRRVYRNRKSQFLLGAVALVAVVVLGLAIWLLQPSHPAGPAPSATGTTSAKATPSATPDTPPAAESQARLFSLLPAGYPPGTCKPITPPQGPLARVSCGKNSDPTAHHPRPTHCSRTALRSAPPLTESCRPPPLLNVLGESNHQASGTTTPTHRRPVARSCAEPSRAIRQSVWTTDAELLIGVVQAELPESTLDQLYRWWASHS